MDLDLSENNLEKLTLENLGFDAAAFEILFKKHFVSLCSYCQFKFGFELDLAKEIVHGAFIKLWEARNTLDKGLSPKPYLYRIIINTSLDSLKHDKIKKEYFRFVQKTTSEVVNSNSFEGIDFKQLRNDINDAVAELPEQMRRIFELSRFEGLKYAQIAATLNISIKTVETQMSRALSKLRSKLSDYLTFYLVMLILCFFGDK